MSIPHCLIFQCDNDEFVVTTRLGARRLIAIQNEPIYIIFNGSLGERWTFERIRKILPQHGHDCKSFFVHAVPFSIGFCDLNPLVERLLRSRRLQELGRSNWFLNRMYWHLICKIVVFAIYDQGYLRSMWLKWLETDRDRPCNISHFRLWSTEN